VNQWQRSGCAILRQRRDFSRSVHCRISIHGVFRYRQASARACARPSGCIIACRQRHAPALDPQRSRAAFPWSRFCRRCLSPRRTLGLRLRAPRGYAKAPPAHCSTSSTTSNGASSRRRGHMGNQWQPLPLCPAPIDDKVVPVCATILSKRDKQIRLARMVRVSIDTPSQDHAPMARATCGAFSFFCCPISSFASLPIQAPRQRPLACYPQSSKGSTSPRMVCPFHVPLPRSAARRLCANRVDAARKSLRRGPPTSVASVSGRCITA